MMLERIMIGRFRLAVLHAARRSIAVGIAVAALACRAPVGAETSDQLYALAKVEKTLVMWAAGACAGYESPARAFEQEFAGVTVSLRGDLSNLLNAKIEEQVRTKKVETDL